MPDEQSSNEVKVTLSRPQAQALYEVLMDVEDATDPERVAIEGIPFDGAPTGQKRRSMRNAWWKIACALGYADGNGKS